MRKSKVIAITNQKGGVGKTVTSVSLGACLARDKKKVLIVDFDPQGSLTKGLGYRDSSSYPYSIKDVLFNEINETSMNYKDTIIHTDESFDLLPANISLSGADIQLSNVMSRETIFKRVIDTLKDDYDYVLIDSNPALNLFTINGLVAADSVIIPVQAEPYACDGLNDLLHTIATAKKQINPNLKIDGILITMTDARTNLSKHIANEVRENYGQHIRVFKTEIPRVVKTSEASLSGQSPVKYAPNSESTLAYQRLAKEVDGISENGFKIAMNPAYELSFLKVDEQNDLVQCIQDTLATPSLAQAQELKRLSQKDELDEDKMVDMLMDVKPNQKEKLSLKMEEINKYFPKSYTPMQKKDIIIKLLGDWAKRKDKSMER